MLIGAVLTKNARRETRTKEDFQILSMAGRSGRVRLFGLNVLNVRRRRYVLLVNWKNIQTKSPRRMSGEIGEYEKWKR